MKSRTGIIAIIMILALATMACSLGAVALSRLNTAIASAANPATSVNLPQAQGSLGTPAPSTAPSQPTPQPAVAPSVTSNGALAAYQQTLEQIYAAVNPSVVNIQVITTGGSGSLGQSGEALGSGFVWDKQGHIVTNNHVVDGASKVTVTFSDGLTVPATVVGTDLNNDLAVVKVDVPADRLQPVTVADSTQVKVGQLAIAIGNPFGLQGSMSAGIISGLDRSLPVGGDNAAAQAGPNYTIPDIIQTDAPINPGNSGGVLVNDQGQVLGVTAAIESASQSNSGIGFVIPSVIVQKVIPALITSGHYDSPWLGLSGTTMGPDIAKAMNLNSDQRGVLVVEVTSGSPAEKAGLHPSSQSTTSDGQQIPVGGDIIVAVDGKTVNTFDELVTYLSRSTSAGQKITLSILRNGQVQSVDLTLGVRPATSATSSIPQQNGPVAGTGALMGIQGITVDATVAQAMNLPADAQGVLVVKTTPGGPAAQAGIRGGSKQIDVNGTSVTVGGDVIIGIDNQPITSIDDLHALLAQAQPGQTVQVTIIRGTAERQVQVTLGGGGTTPQ